jgi:hypothetical protein
MSPGGVPQGLGEFERELIRRRTGEGRAKERGGDFVRTNGPAKLRHCIQFLTTLKARVVCGRAITPPRDQCRSSDKKSAGKGRPLDLTSVMAKYLRAF